MELSVRGLSIIPKCGLPKYKHYKIKRGVNKFGLNW